MHGNAPCMHVDGEFCPRCYPPKEERKHWGYSLALDMKFCDPVVIRSKEKLEEFVIQLCKMIDMNRFGECQIVHFGEGNKEGFSLVQLIETSCITGHFANDLNSAFIDIFSCKRFNPAFVQHFTVKYFGAKEHDSHFIARG